jgi:DNA repair exonuclease SbcCD ATPase subunit
MKVKHLIVQAFERSGYLIFRADEWRCLQQQLADKEEAHRAVSELKQRLADKEEAHRAVSELKQRLAETEEAHQRLENSEKAHRALSDQLKQLEQVRALEEERLRSEHAFYAKRADELEKHNRLLVESATQRELKLQEKERELTQARIEAAERSNDLEKRLAECVNERHLLTLRIGRAQARVQAFKRRRDHLETELRLSREQISRLDTSGRIRELEAENRGLWQRISDLEVYLQETRGSSRPYYL